MLCLLDIVMALIFWNALLWNRSTDRSWDECTLWWATFHYLLHCHYLHCRNSSRYRLFPCFQACWIQWCSLNDLWPCLGGRKKSLKIQFPPIFGLKWDKSAQNRWTTEKKKGGEYKTDIQLLFDITFISASVIVEWVLPAVKRKFVPGDSLVAGFESRPHLKSQIEKGMGISLKSPWRCPVIYVKAWLYLILHCL